MTKVLWLITARSGSKGLPGKNIKPLGGIPLLAWRILSARKLGGTIWLSTDSPEYAALGRQYGAETPFLRPAEYATDGPCHGEAIGHAVDFAVEKGLSFDMLCLLQPTSPFCNASCLQRGLDALEPHPESAASIAVSRVPVPSLFIVPKAQYLTELSQRYATMKDNRRQAQADEITPCGGFYLVRWDFFLEKRTFWDEKALPVLLEFPETLDIDDLNDFEFAKFLLKYKNIQPDLYSYSFNK